MARPKSPQPANSGLRRKAPVSSRLPGIKVSLPKDLSIEEIKKRLKRRLRLTFMPDDWQAHLIQRVLQGYDSVLCAGTGYGKSLIFEGLAILAKKGNVVVVISPLKALERDQANQASKKGIHTVVLNEDTTKSAGLWDRARTKATIIYTSPEMALSPRFISLWTDSAFRARLTAIVVDEAHCIEDWGGDDFRPQYSELHSLRSFTGQDVPYLACTATCMTSTFDLLWDTLGFGYRPFWGLDVGVDRPNLFFQVQGIENTNYPLLDILNIFPSDLSDTSTRDDLPKAMLYFDTEAACREAVQFIRKMLPKHLRGAVHAFSSTLSEEGKATNWDNFMANLTRLLCATDAAGMGCNVSDIKYVISIGIPKSAGQVYQRWGRAGRDRKTEAVCVQLVPAWAIQPEATLNPVLSRVGGKAKPVEKKENAVRRAKLPNEVNKLLNLKHERRNKCYHCHSSVIFRPETRLDTYNALGDDATPVKLGERSRSSPYDMLWTVLELGRSPDRDRCCSLCNDDQLEPCDVNDPRLSKFAADFIYPIARPLERPSSAGAVPAPPHIELQVTTEDEDQLEVVLLQWRKDQHPETELMLSPAILLPPKQLSLLVKAADVIAATPVITAASICKITPLPHLSGAQLSSLVDTVTKWKSTLTPVPPPESRPTPRAERRSAKRSRTGASERAASPTPRSADIVMLCPLGPEDDDEDGDEMDCEAMTEAPTPRRKGSAPNPSTPRQPPPQPSFTTPGHYRPDSYEPSPLKKKTYYRAQTRLQSPLPPRTVVNPTSSLSTPSLSVAATTSSLASATARVSAATPAPPTAIPQSTNPYMALVGSSAWASSPSVWVSSPTPQAWQGASRPMSTSSLSAEWPPLPTAATPSAPSRPFIQYQPRK